jgi:hypothetical protein
MPEIGVAELQATSDAATSWRAVDLATVTSRANEEHSPTARSATKALPEKKRNLGQHRKTK